MTQNTQTQNNNSTTPTADSNGKQKRKRRHIIRWNLLAMMILSLAAVIAVVIGLHKYTLHGEEVDVPNVTELGLVDALQRLEAAGLTGEVADSVNLPHLPRGSIFKQHPEGGQSVKLGRIIALTVNTGSAATVTLPDIIENSGLRVAEMTLKNMGLQLTEPEYTDGEAGYVYGVKCNGRSLQKDDRVKVTDVLTLVVGRGTYDNSAELADSLEAAYNEAMSEFLEGQERNSDSQP